MPSAKELLLADGWTAPEKGTDNLNTLLEASDEMRGAVSAKNDLLKWKQENADKVKGFDTIQEERNTALEEVKATAKKNKDLEGYLAAESEQVKIKEATIQLRNQQALKGSQDSAEMEFASLFSLQENGLSHAKNIISHKIDDSGEVVRSYVFEGANYSSLDDLKPALSKSWMASSMKGPDSKGATSTGGNAGGSSKKLKDMTGSERIAFKRDDPEGFKLASSNL